VTTLPDTDSALVLVAQAAEDALRVLATPSPLTAAGAQPGDDQVAAVFGRAVVARAVGAAGSVGLLAGPELLAAADAVPGGSLAATVQPALDAAAARLGVQLEAGQEVAPDQLGALLGAWHVVPLIGEGFAGGIAASTALLSAAPTSEPTAAPTPTPVAAPTLPSSAVTHEPTAPPAPPRAVTAHRGIEMLNGVDLELTVELGRTRILVRDLLALAPGDVVELDRAAGSPADLLVGGRLIARGEVVVVDEDFGLRITHIVEPAG